MQHACIDARKTAVGVGAGEYQIAATKLGQRARTCDDACVAGIGRLVEDKRTVVGDCTSAETRTGTSQRAGAERSAAAVGVGARERKGASA